jgi:hypothetical protein
MPFLAGAVVGEASLDTKNYDEGINRLNKGHESLTGSMVEAGVILKGLEKAFRVVTDVLKDSVKEYINAEEATAQLEAVLKSTGMAAGITAQQAESLSKELSQLSTFEKDTILKSENLLLTFTKIGKDVFPEAEKAIVDLSTALGQDLQSSTIQIGKALNDPIVGLTALKRVGVSFTESQIEMIKQLQKSGNLLGAQKIILKELETEFGGSAEAISKTFGGTLARINNQMIESKENFGKFISVALKPLADEFFKAQIAFNNFLEKASTANAVVDIMGKLSGAFNVVKGVLTDFIGGTWKTVAGEIDKVKNSFGKLFDSVGGGSGKLQILSGAITVISMAFEIGIKFIGAWLQATIDLDTAIVETAKLAGLFFVALVDPSKWGEVTKQFEKTKTAFADYGKHIISNGKDIVDTVVKDFQTFPDKVKVTTDKMAKNFNDGNEAMKKSWELTNQQLVITTTNIKKEINDSWDGMWGSIGKSFQTAMDDMKTNVKKGGTEMAQGILGAMQMAVEAIKNIYDGISSTIQMALQNEADVQKAADDKKLKQLQDSKDQTLAARQDQYDRDLAALDQALSQGNIKQSTYDAKKKILDKKKADDEAKINHDKDEAIAKQKKENLKKENEIAKKQFEANKANQIANVWISFALGTISAFANGISQLGPIAGAIIGAVETAAMLAIAIAQTVVISQQQFVPAMAKGGQVTAGQPYLTGELGAELFVPNTNGTIIPAAQTKNIMNQGQTINVSFDGAVISNMLDLDNITNNVLDKLNYKLKQARA